eukprot:jgi/Psemu1/236676/estExt_Genewise1.C_520112
MAQHYLANAHSSGIWPVPAAVGGGDYDYDYKYEHEHEHEYQNGSSSAASLVEDLYVFDEWLPTSGENTRQVDKAYLLWHMAAIGGNIESAMALAHRLDKSASVIESGGSGGGNSNSDNNNNNNNSGDVRDTCEDSLPYYLAAADGILDQLEVSQDSRAKLIPPMDKHTLAEVHMHGGTSSQLDWNNKPDESKEALQFYHLKATTKKSASSSASEEDGIDVMAAFTLAHMHHHGMRGVEQNLTKSLEYYEIAGTHGHWESAGHACNFYLWGIGAEQDAHKALQFCKLGAPYGYEGCRQRREQVNKEKNSKRIASHDDSSSHQLSNCDEYALNGMGLLYLLGVRGVLEVNMSMAEKYFTLAKELGSIDAYYNLAMMWLGWKTHFKRIDDLKENGFTPDATVGDKQYYKGPVQSDVLNAIKMLNVAAKLGHIQSKHRLGLIYANGLNHTTNVMRINFVKKDCKRAKENLEWIVNNASPTLSKRLRRAYKEYIAGNLEVSVRNYLAAAEIGSIVGQVNAAFLMERGVCLGLGAADCAKASVRLWKAAAARGNAEACLRVGDFYYYGRLHGKKLHNGPFGWIQYFLHPEKFLPTLLRERGFELLTLARNLMGHNNDDDDDDENNNNNNNKARTLSSSTDSTCEATEDGTCPNKSGTGTAKKNLDQEMEKDLLTAAHYYQLAGEKHMSARANFNLGFMHQWGLGLKQDFPMAKRHYDLALNRNYREAEIAVQIGLMAMNAHEFALRCMVLIEDWWYQRTTPSTKTTNTNTPSSAKAPSTQPRDSGSPAPQSTNDGNQPRTPGHRKSKTREEVIMAHLFDRSSLTIVMLILLLLLVQFMMTFVGRPQRR